MIFDVPTLVENLRRTMTLRAGSVIFTGTPSGVGFTRQPPVFLRDGDEVVVEIERIGRLRNTVRG
jgi:2-keto-4-pentenoate hydratase/2-oxohepta-3-ene-1,7-dioic acid hydratase in catechol pathway